MIRPSRTGSPWPSCSRSRTSSGRSARSRSGKSSTRATRPRSLPDAPVAGRLGIVGQFFTLDGQPHTIIESSEFSLYKRFLDGERAAVDAVLAERAALGFNGLRVWLLNQTVIRGRNGADDGARIHPADYPNFYEQLAPFARLCGEWGFAVEYTVFTSTSTLLPRQEDQQAHLSLTADAVRGLGNVLLELVNEADQHDNAPVPGLMLRTDGLLASRGSNGADAPPPRHDAPWDYELYHTNGLEEWWRKTGHNAQEWANESGVPCVSNENTRPDNDSNPNHYYDAAMGGALLCAGSCYHSQSGKFSTLFTGVDLDCAKAWVAGAKSVPLEFQRGLYRHRTELETPDIIRVYSKILGDGREYVIRIRK